MSILSESLEHTTISDLVHVYVAPVGTKNFDLKTFNFTGEDIGAWKWLGDTSSESLPEFERDDDKDSSKRTADRKNTRNTSKMTGTITALSLSKRFFELVTSGGIAEEDGYVVTASTGGRDWAVMIVSEDGGIVDALELYYANLSTSAIKKFDLENYSSVAVKVAVYADKQGRMYKAHYATKRTVAPAAAVPGVGG